MSHHTQIVPVDGGYLTVRSWAVGTTVHCAITGSGVHEDSPDRLWLGGDFEEWRP